MREKPDAPSASFSSRIVHYDRLLRGVCFPSNVLADMLLFPNFDVGRNRMSEVSAVAISLAKPGYEEQLAQALEGLLAPTSNEPGMLQYEMYRDMKEPQCFVFIERWESEETFDAHCNSPHVTAYLEKVVDWVESNKIHVLKRGK
jgi:quinol monooxygenase YgiN